MGFSAIFQWIFRAENEKEAAILCARLRKNIDLQQKNLYYDFSQEKVSNAGLYQCYASNSCVTDTFAES